MNRALALLTLLLLTCAVTASGPDLGLMPTATRFVPHEVQLVAHPGIDYILTHVEVVKDTETGVEIACFSAETALSCVVLPARKK